MPYFRATSSVLPRSRPTSEITFDAVDGLDRVEVLDAERARAGERDVDGVMGFLAVFELLFQDEMADGGVAGGHVIEAVRDARACGPPAASAIAPRAISHITSSIPSLPASRTYSTCGTCGERGGVVDQAIEKPVVPLAC